MTSCRCEYPRLRRNSKARFTLELRTVADAVGGRAALNSPAGTRRATLAGPHEAD